MKYRIGKILSISFLIVLALSGIHMSYAQDEPTLPVLYMSSRDTIWQVQGEGVQETLTLQGKPPVPLSKLSATEQAYFETLNIDAHWGISELYPRIGGLWSVSGGRLIIEVNYEVCGMAADHFPCAGYSEFLLMDSDYSTRILAD